MNNVYKRNIIFTLTTILIVLQQHKIMYNQTKICGVSHKKKLTHVCPLRVAYLSKFSKCLLEITYIMGEGSNFFLFYKRALHASLRTDTCHRNGTRGADGTSQHYTAKCTKPGSIHAFCNMCNTKNFPVNAVQFNVLHISLYRTLHKLWCILFILLIYITVYLIFNLHDLTFLLDILVVLFINFHVIYIQILWQGKPNFHKRNNKDITWNQFLHIVLWNKIPIDDQHSCNM